MRLSTTLNIPFLKSAVKAGATALIALAGMFVATGALAESGDAAAGSKLTTACQACHGTDGNGLAPNYPNIAGQNERYLFRQLQMIQSDERYVALMAGQLNGMSEQNLRDIAAFYADKAPKLAQAQGDDAQVAMARQLYRGGSLEKGVAACTACHSPSGAGNAPAGFPRISGQSPEYTIAQLTAYREGARATDESYGAMMRQVAANLNDTEIAALADYLQGLH